MQKIKNIFICSLILSQLLPINVWAGVTGKKTKIAIIPIESENKELTQINNEIAIALRNMLKPSLNILKQEHVKQIVKTNKVPSNGPKSTGIELEVISLIQEGRSAYQKGRNAQLALSHYDAAIDFLKTKATPSKAASDLYINTLVNKAWVLFREDRKDDAGRIIDSIYGINPGASLNLKGTSGRFRKFARNRTKQAVSSLGTVNLSSVPGAVDVFVDGILVGSTPKTINLPVGTYTLSFGSPGRKTVRKKIHLKTGTTKKVRVRLPWESNRNKQIKLQDNVFDPLDVKSRMVYISQIGASIRADKTVVIDFIKKGGTGLIPRAVVYDNKYHQILAPITYKKVSLSGLKRKSPDIIRYFARNLKPYLSKDSLKLHKSDYDRSLILDERIARRKKSLTKNPIMWAGLGVLVLGGIITGLVLSSGGSSSSPGTGSVTVDFGPFKN